MERKGGEVSARVSRKKKTIGMRPQKKKKKKKSQAKTGKSCIGVIVHQPNSEFNQKKNIVKKVTSSFWGGGD